MDERPQHYGPSPFEARRKRGSHLRVTVRGCGKHQDVDARVKPGHNGVGSCRSEARLPAAQLPQHRIELIQILVLDVQRAAVAAVIDLHL